MSSCSIPNTKRPMAGLTDPDLLVKAAKKHKADEFKSALALSISVEETVKTTLRRPLISVSRRGSTRGYLTSYYVETL
ncbi:hypothetical protein E4U28_003187, partial [Claviceps purpurea]